MSCAALAVFKQASMLVSRAQAVAAGRALRRSTARTPSTPSTLSPSWTSATGKSRAAPRSNPLTRHCLLCPPKPSAAVSPTARCACMQGHNVCQQVLGPCCPTWFQKMYCNFINEHWGPQATLRLLAPISPSLPSCQLSGAHGCGAMIHAGIPLSDAALPCCVRALQYLRVIEQALC